MRSSDVVSHTCCLFFFFLVGLLTGAAFNPFIFAENGNRVTVTEHWSKVFSKGQGSQGEISYF